MSQRVAICTASAFLAIVVRRTLARSRHLEATEHRTTAAALTALRTASLAIVDAEMLGGDEDGVSLRRAIAGMAAIVIDARGRGVDVGDRAIVIRGRLAGELDLAVIEGELLPAVGRALRQRDGAEAAAAAPLRSERARTEAYDGALDLVVLGVSTGGPALLLALLAEVRAPAIPMIIAQHMPESETAGLAARLTEVSGLAVREVGAGPIAMGSVGLLRGGAYFRVVRRGGVVQLVETMLAGNPFHPNVDLVLTSAVEAGLKVGAAILTGMGRDGAEGARAMAERGLPVIAQRPDTCAVAGMPQAVIDSGAARWVQSPERIAATLNVWSDAARGASA